MIKHRFLVLIFLGILSVGIFPINVQSQHAAVSDKVDPFEYNRHIFDNLNYIKSAKWVPNEGEAITKFVEGLKQKGFAFTATNPEKIRIAHNYVEKNPNMSLQYYETNSGNEWIYLVSHKEPDSIKNERMRMGKYQLETFGGNSSFYEPIAFSFNITQKTGEEPSTVSAYLVAPHHIFRIGLALDFSVPGSALELSAEQNKQVRSRFKELLGMVQVLADKLVLPDEWIKKPLNGIKLTSEQRLYGFTQFWTEVKYNFAFFDQVPELNWDEVLYEYLPIIQQDQSNEQYYKTLELICAKLQDGHTNIYPPASLSLYNDQPAISLRNFNKKAFVVNTTEVFRDQLPLGSEIIAVDDIPLETYLREKIFPYLSSSTEHILYDWGIRGMLEGDKGTELKLSFKSPEGKLGVLNTVRDRFAGGNDWLRQGSNWQLFEFEEKAGKIAYISLNSFGDEQIIEEFEKRIDSIKSCKGVIIDLRGNGGGNSKVGYAILNHFTKKPYKGSASRTRNHMASHKAWGQYVDKEKPLEELSEFDRISRLTLEGKYWHEFEVDEIVPEEKSIIELPLVVLIGHNTASAAEDFLVALDQIGIAKVIGSPTFGSTGQPLMMDMPGGGGARICTKRDTYPDGREFVGYGIPPDFKVEASIEDYLADKDVVLEYALKYLKEHPAYSSDKK